MNSAYFALIAASVIWGATGPIMKMTLISVPVFSLAFIRFFFASILMYFLVRGRMSIKREHVLPIILAGICGVTINISLFFLGLKLTSALNAGILVSSMPIFTFLSAHFFLKERIQKKYLLGGMFGIMGIFVIISRSVFQEGVNVSPLGDFLIILAVMAFVTYETLSKKLSKSYYPLVIAFYSFIVGTVTFLPLAIWEFERMPNWINNLPVFAIIGVLYGIFFSSFAAYSLWQWGLSKIDESKVGFFFYLDPISATVTAVVLLSEVVTPTFILGAILISLGLFLAEAKISYFPFKRTKKINIEVEPPIQIIEKG